MPQVRSHLDVEDLQAGYRSSQDVTQARHDRVIWLSAQADGAEMAELRGFARRWVEQLRGFRMPRLQQTGDLGTLLLKPLKEG